MLDELDFQRKADAALEDLFDALGEAGELHGFESDFNSGALSVEFDDPPAKFVVSPNSPVRQIWISAHATSFKLDWDPAKNAFVLPATGQTLKQVLAEAIGKQLGDSVHL
jgi:iron-sulfur cluster assembly protein CyaY